MSSLRRVLREPLVHFLGAGALIYLAWGLWGEPEEDPRRIVVDRAALLQYVQYQAKAFEPATFSAQLDAMSPAERQQLIDSYVREEVLYREARALGLEQGDYVMRLRLVQKMGFLTEVSSVAEPTEDELRQYLEDNAVLYAVAPSYTFTHVFIDPLERGEARAKRDAERTLATLNSARAGFNDSPRHTDRFAFLQNYVERTPDYIASHFGPGFMQALETLPVASGSWQGPVQSDQGWHLVLLTAKTPARMPAVAEIRERLADDLTRDRAADLQEQVIQTLIDQYEVQLDLGRAAP